MMWWPPLDQRTGTTTPSERPNSGCAHRHKAVSKLQSRNGSRAPKIELAGGASMSFFAGGKFAASFSLLFLSLQRTLLDSAAIRWLSTGRHSAVPDLGAVDETAISRCGEKVLGSIKNCPSIYYSRCLGGVRGAKHIMKFFFVLCFFFCFVFEISCGFIIIIIMTVDQCCCVCFVPI